MNCVLQDNSRVLLWDLGWVGLRRGGIKCGAREKILREMIGIVEHFRVKVET